MPRKETSELRRFLALLIVLLSTIAVVVSLTRHDPPPKAAGVVLMASQRPHLMPDDTNPPTTTTVAVQPREPMAPQVKWPPAPTQRHGGCDKPSTCPQLRQCENGGSYAAGTNPSFYGAYQFADRSTWGMSAAQQDTHADEMYAQRGAQPWPVCGRFLR